MAYKLPADERLSTALLRCAREQLDRAVGELSEGISEEPGRAVHNARKAIKKERSLLRLARGSMPSKQRRAENAALREAARGLSGTRDAEVMVLTLEQLSDRFAGQLPATAFEKVRKRFESRLTAQRRALVGSALNDGAVQELGAVRVRVDDWQLTKEGWKAIEPGLLRTYRRGRKAFSRVRKGGSSEELHNWRKRVKDLWYQERLLTPSCGPVTKAQAKEAHHLADLLGDDHDLALLREALMEGIPVPADIDAVIRLVDHRRAELQAEAIDLGRRVYAETPKAFRRRMRRSWDAGRAAADALVEQRPVELAAATRKPS